MSNTTRSLMITAFLASLGFIADIAGVFGIDAESKITARWLLIETVIMGGVIIFLIQFLMSIKKELGSSNSNSLELIKQLMEENNSLREQLKSITYERELLQAAIQVIEADESRLSDTEIAYLSAVSSGMSGGRDALSESDKYEIVKGIIKLSCADKNFRPEQQMAVREIGEKYNLPDAVIIGLIGEQVSKMKKPTIISKD